MDNILFDETTDCDDGDREDSSFFVKMSGERMSSLKMIKDSLVLEVEKQKCEEIEEMEKEKEDTNKEKKQVQVENS